MDAKPFVNVVGLQCLPESEERLCSWYDDIHAPLLMKFKGLKKITRYKTANEGEEYPTYLMISEFESREAFELYEASPELAAARDEMRESWTAEELKVQWQVQWRAQYEFAADWKR
ncbi:MAG: hypothetical protein J7L90_02120 [Dehalococcoidia bacterium]|nr:hypothetical protein [Dehalococcoidia bacterium]